MGGSSKNKPPKPPIIPTPKPSAQELELQGLQTQQAKKLMAQSDTTFGNSQTDRNSALSYLDILNNPPKLSDGEQSLINQMGDSYLNLYQKGITEGNQKEIFDTNLRDSLASLSSNGIMNSTFGAESIQNLYKEQARAMAQASDQAGIQKLGLTNDALKAQVAKNMDLFQTMYTGAGQGSALANQLASSGSQISAGTAEAMKSNRMDAFNVNTQNAQARYGYQNQLFQQQQQKKKGIGGGIGSTLGALAGLALAAPTGGMSMLMGAGLGAGIGGGAGSYLGGFF